MLAGQYESWILPLAVIFAIPLAALGTVLSLRLTGLPNNLYVQIGLVLLIALSAKNAILVVEMARQRREAGCSILTAAVEGARLRFRPILMTSFTFILGVAPLILATGAGAASRQSLGISVASGMLASTCLAVVFVPSFFVVLQRLQERRRGRSRPPASDRLSRPMASLVWLSLDAGRRHHPLRHPFLKKQVADGRRDRSQNGDRRRLRKGDAIGGLHLRHADRDREHRR